MVGIQIMEIAPLSMRNYLSPRPLKHKAMWPEAAAKPPHSCLPSYHCQSKAPECWPQWSPASVMTSHAAAVNRRPPGHALSQALVTWPHSPKSPAYPIPGAWLFLHPAFARALVCLQPWVPVTVQAHSFAGLDLWILSFAMQRSF